MTKKTKKEQRLRDELEMIDWDEVWSHLPTERCDDDRTPLDDERDAFLAKVLKEEGMKAYCRIVDTEWELSVHQWNGGYRS
jgi:hypothetical protein